MDRNEEYEWYDTYRDIDGHPVERSRVKHPYSYDAYVQWKKGDLPKNCEAVYHDRMQQWDYDKWTSSMDSAFPPHASRDFGSNPALTEKMLRLYFDSPELELHAICEGCNVSNGYPYWIFYFK